MKRIVFGLLLGLVAAISVQAIPKIVPLAELEPSDQQRRTVLKIAQIMESFHYTKPHINDAVSSLTFDRFLEMLDANRSFLTQQDVRKFERYRFVFDDSLQTGQLDPAYFIFKSFRQKVEARMAYAKNLLDNYSFDFNLNESYVFDRSDEAWSADEEVLSDQWRQRVKNDVLNKRLADETSMEEIKKALHQRYDNVARRVKQMDSGDVFQTFVNAFTLSIEPHTSYMSPRGSENFDIGMRLSLQGIGAVLRSKNEHTQVIRTVAGGPAARSGEISGGDRIIGVAQGKKKMVDVVGWRLQDVVDLIRGPKESTIRLNVIAKREGISGKAHEVVLVRDEIKLEDKAVKSEILDSPELGGLKIGVIDIPAFYRDFAGQAAGERNFRSTTRDTRKLLAKFEQEGVDGIIIDLRRNGGGSLTEATELTGLFINEGPVVQVKNSAGSVEIEKDTDPEQVYSGPLAVLVDRNSASASEIFAGAIQDYHRGLIIGEPTFGKGTVQTLINLGAYLKTDDDLGRLRLTMAQFFRVKGASTQHRGVTPDVIFPTAKGAENHGERALDHAIPWAAISPAIDHSKGSFPISELRSKDQQRISKNEGFKFLIEREEAFIKAIDSTEVSLNERLRRTERKEREAKQLASLNGLRIFRGLKPLTSLEDPDEFVEDADKDVVGIKKIMLDESALILSDFIHAIRPVTAQLQ